jgi:D-aspartate ligase
MRRVAERPPILLCNADYYGTLAATRLFGQSGISVVVASEHMTDVARWSRWASRSLRCPSSLRGREFIDWLLEFGRREPGYVLYPTSDDLTFFCSLYQEELGQYFHVKQPPIASIMNVLDKKRLYVAAADAGLHVPNTRFPESESEAETLGKELQFPVLIKPRTQILYSSRSKGELALDASEIASKYRSFARSNHYQSELMSRYAVATHPMLQSYHAQSATRIYSLAGFVDEQGTLLAARGSYKVLQRPRRLGIGLCFEDAPVDEQLAAATTKLCQLTGYHGLFQTESIDVDGRKLLIDFNPRFYNQLAFDIARSLPLPLIVYFATLGDSAEVARLTQASRTPAPGSATVFCNRFGVGVMLSLQRLANTISASELREWKEWYARNRASIVDPTADGNDLLPVVADVASQLNHCIRHPRSFVRSMVLNR